MNVFQAFWKEGDCSGLAFQLPRRFCKVYAETNMCIFFNKCRGLGKLSVLLLWICDSAGNCRDT